MKRRPLFAPLLFPLLGFIATALLAVWLFEAYQETTTVIVVRHAEKLPDNGDDPALSEAGNAWAEWLAQLLADSDIQGIYASQYRRTQQTVAPLAAKTGLGIEVVDAGAVEDLVEMIYSRHSGGKILVAAHSNTVPLILEALGVDDPPALAENNYGDIFIVTDPRLGRASLSKLRLTP